WGEGLASGTLSVGVVGAGTIAREVHLPVLSAMPKVRIAWVADRDDVRARALARAFRLPAVSLPPCPSELPPCQAVLLAIPVGARGGYYQALAARGTAVFAEKPFALTATDHQQFLSLFPPHAIACGY